MVIQNGKLHARLRVRVRASYNRVQSKSSNSNFACLETTERFMPIYEYSCRKCSARVEVMQKITDKPLKRCKSCGGKLEKEWSTSSFQLKGSGWYVTDYAAKKSGAAGDKEPATKSDDATKTDGAADTKTAATPAETKAEPAATATTAAAAEETKRKKTSRPAATSNGSKRD